MFIDFWVDRHDFTVVTFTPRENEAFSSETGARGWGEVELMNSRCANKTRTNESDWSIKLLKLGPEKRLERFHYPSAQPFQFN